MYTLAYFCLTNTLSAISIWTPQILKSFNEGSSNITIGLLAAIPQICTILGMIYWSRHSDKHQERKHHTALPFLFAAAGWLLASATDHNLIQLLGIVMASTGSFSAMAIFHHAGSVDQFTRQGDRHCGHQCHRQYWLRAQPVYDWLAKRYHR